MRQKKAKRLIRKLQGGLSLKCLDSYCLRSPWLLRYRKNKTGPLLLTVLPTVRDITGWERGRASPGQTMAKGHRQANV